MCQPSAKFQVIDDLGNKVTFNSVPLRVIALAPNLTEMIYELEVEDYLVGNTLYCNYPSAAKEITKVGDMLTFDYEKIISLKPDLLFITVEGNTKATYDKFTELGLKIFVSNPRNFEGIKKTFLDMGNIFKMEKATEEKVVEWTSIVDNIKKEGKKYPAETIMFLIEVNPIMLAGSNTFLNEYIELCGMKNIAENSTLNYPIYSREEILKRDPDFIAYPTGDKKDIKYIIEIYPEWKELKAVKNNQVLFLDWDLFSRPGPRFAQALKEMFIRLHPEEISRVGRSMK